MSQHKIGPRQYLMVFSALIVLTILTVGLSRFELGLLHTWLGLAFAVIKAMLVVLFFMHVLHSHRLTWVAGASGVFLLTIMLVMTLMDYMTRSPEQERPALDNPLIEGGAVREHVPQARP